MDHYLDSCIESQQEVEAVIIHWSIALTSRDRSMRQGSRTCSVTGRHFFSFVRGRGSYTWVHMHPLFEMHIKYISKCQKNTNKNASCISWHVTYSQSCFRKNRYVLCLVLKRQIFGVKIVYFSRHYLSFLHRVQKLSVLRETLRVLIERVPLHAKFLFLIFYFLKYVLYI
jgi:hypothetical protein